MTFAALPSMAILIATVNGAGKLRKCLAWSASQTQPPDRLAVIDDGSTDDSGDVPREYESLVTYSIRAPAKLIFNALYEGLLQIQPDGYVSVLGADHLLYRRPSSRRRPAQDHYGFRPQQISSPSYASGLSRAGRIGYLTCKNFYGMAHNALRALDFDRPARRLS